MKSKFIPPNSVKNIACDSQNVNQIEQKKSVCDLLKTAKLSVKD